jgi:hypothetical protein
LKSRPSDFALLDHLLTVLGEILSGVGIVIQAVVLLDGLGGEEEVGRDEVGD